MNFSTAVKTCFRKSWNTEDRASRSEFWYWQLFINVFGIPFDMVDEHFYGFTLMGPFGLFFALATLLPSIFVIARRLHDVDRSFYWFFLSLTIVGLIPLIYWLCKKGTVGENSFGPDPLPQNAPNA